MFFLFLPHSNSPILPCNYVEHCNIFCACHISTTSLFTSLLLEFCFAWVKNRLQWSILYSLTAKLVESVNLLVSHSIHIKGSPPPVKWLFWNVTRQRVNLIQHKRGAILFIYLLINQLNFWQTCELFVNLSLSVTVT